MSGAGRMVFQPGAVLTASQVQNYLQDQAVMVFAGTAARGTALGAGTVTDGMMSYLQDTNTVEVYKTTGTAITGWEAPYPISGNAIINGAFDIWQRGTSTTTSGAYLADRWRAEKGSAASFTYSQQAFTAGTAPVSGYEGSYFARVATGVGTDTSLIGQKIEDVRTFAGQTVTLSFWAKAAASLTLNLRADQRYGSGGSSDSATSAGTVSVTTSWARYTSTFVVPSVAGKTIGTGSNLDIFFYWSNTAAVTFDLWGVQLEAGQTATPFRRNANSIQGELAACQRYYYRQYTASAISSRFAMGFQLNTTSAECMIYPPVIMRTVPTISYDSLYWTDGTSFNSAVSSVAVYQGGTGGECALIVNFSAAGATQRTGALSGTGTVTGQTNYIALSAEL